MRRSQRAARLLLGAAALLGGQPDPQQLARVESPDTVASLQRIQRYLASHCEIR